MRIHLVLVATLLMGPSLFSQSPTAQPGTASITGAAMIAIDRQLTPVRRARVNVRAPGGAILTTDTGTLGQFRVDGLSAGSYEIEIDKPGFVPIGHVTVLDIRDGQAAKATVMMQRGAAIEGRLVTTDGEPATGLKVSAVRLGYGLYGKKPVAIRQTTTDDLGRFRLHTLMAGEYYIEAAPDPYRTQVMPGNKPVRTYFASASRLNEARIIALAPEQQLTNIDFAVAAAALATVSGTITTSTGKPPVTFSLRVPRAGGPAGEVGCYLLPARADGTRDFQCPNVPPGDFRLLVAARATPDADVEFAVMPITVEGSDLSNLRVMTTPGVRVSGRIEVEGGTPLPPNTQIAALETEGEFPSPSQGAGTTATPPVVVGADGAFTFTSVSGPRLVRMTRLPDGWTLKGVWLDGVEISDAPTTFATSERPAVVRVVLTPRTGSVEGTVLNTDRQPAVKTRVIVFTDDVRKWSFRSRFIRTIETGATGHYSITGLLPGQYRVAFVDLLDDGAWEDPDVLTRLRPSATPIVITGTERLTLDGRIK